MRRRKPVQVRWFGRSLGVLSLLTAGLGWVGTTAAPAGADPLDITCAGTQSVTYSPGLTLEPRVQTVSINQIYSPCTSLTQSAITSGRWQAAPTTEQSCLTLAEPGSNTKVITWNTGDTSTIAYNRMVSTVGGTTTVTNTGTVTSGLFVGDTTLEQIVAPSVDLLDCLSPPGITSRFGIVTLLITSV